MSEIESKCVWTEDAEDSNAYDTSCGASFYFAEASAVEAGVNYCHNCGKRVEVWKMVWNAKTDEYESELERAAPPVGEAELAKLAALLLEIEFIEKFRDRYLFTKEDPK